MKRLVENTSLYETFVGGNWQRDSTYYLLDKHGNEYPILIYYNRECDEIEYYCENTCTSAYHSISEFVSENNNRLQGILHISNPFNIEIN